MKDKPLSRQRLHQLNMKRLNRCASCGKKMHPVLRTCAPCMEKSNLRTRERKGYNIKVHGGPGRPRKCLDETGTQAVSEVILVMSKADYTLSNRELSYSLGVSENTVKKYRKIYGQDAVIADKTDPASVMANADYSLTDKELVYSMRVSKPTVEKYRKIYAPETVKPPRPYVRKQK